MSALRYVEVVKNREKTVLLKVNFSQFIHEVHQPQK